MQSSKRKELSFTMFNDDNLDIIQDDSKKKMKYEKPKKTEPKKEVPTPKVEEEDSGKGGALIITLLIVLVLLIVGIIIFWVHSKTNSSPAYSTVQQSDNNLSPDDMSFTTEDAGSVAKKFEDGEKIEDEDSGGSEDGVSYTSIASPGATNTYTDGFNVSLSRTIRDDIKESIFKQFSDLPDADLFEAACKDGTIEDYCEQRMNERTIVTYVKCEIENEYDKEALKKGLENYKDVDADALYAGAIVKGDGYTLYLVFEKTTE